MHCFISLRIFFVLFQCFEKKCIGFYVFTRIFSTVPVFWESVASINCLNLKHCKVVKKDSISMTRLLSENSIFPPSYFFDNYFDNSQPWISCSIKLTSRPLHKRFSSYIQVVYGTSSILQVSFVCHQLFNNDDYICIDISFA